MAALQRRQLIARCKGLGDCDLVFPDTSGGFLRGSNFTRMIWEPMRKASDIQEGVTFHDLRHTHASLLLAQNCHPKIVQGRLGHCNIGVILNTYSHLLPGMQASTKGKASTKGTPTFDDPSQRITVCRW